MYVHVAHERHQQLEALAILGGELWPKLGLAEPEPRLELAGEAQVHPQHLLAPRLAQECAVGGEARQIVPGHEFVETGHPPLGQAAERVVGEVAFDVFAAAHTVGPGGDKGAGQGAARCGDDQGGEATAQPFPQRLQESLPRRIGIEPAVKPCQQRRKAGIA